MRKITTLALTLGLVAGTAAAKPHLRDVSEIDDNMLWVALAVEISDKCGDISPRMLKGLAFLASLKNRAESMGYSDDEIKAYVQSKSEKARMRQRGEAYVKSKGLDPKREADLCELGKSEIARNSQIGVLLRAR